ncbi:CRISPR-associated endonuclease Cas2 [Acidobacterium ailaaui]|jgi:CRISPR-associated protein Cas2|uniref:CRISPR-associated endonuclease Cas2 n=1 Tax=Pseudacidobacterium ailaaui TaxID=1382359 RepID=UPI0005D29941
MRSSYLVCYDISDDKRLEKVFKLIRGFGGHLQFCVFECQFTASDLVRCREALRTIIPHEECRLDPSANRAFAELSHFFPTVVG